MNELQMSSDLCLSVRVKKKRKKAGAHPSKGPHTSLFSPPPLLLLLLLLPFLRSTCTTRYGLVVCQSFDTRASIYVFVKSSRIRIASLQAQATHSLYVLYWLKHVWRFRSYKKSIQYTVLFVYHKNCVVIWITIVFEHFFWTKKASWNFGSLLSLLQRRERRRDFFKREKRTASSGNYAYKLRVCTGRYGTTLETNFSAHLSNNYFWQT